MSFPYITHRQKKVFAFFSIIAMAFIAFVVLVYIPVSRKLALLKDEFLRTQFEVTQIKRYAGQEMLIEDIILLLNKKKEALDEKFPPKEEIILRHLSAVATGMGIEVISTRPQKKRVIRDFDKSAIDIKGAAVQEMPISMNLKAPYKKFGDFLKKLRDECPVFTSIDSVWMTKAPDTESPVLDITLNINTYLIVPMQNE